MSNGPYAAAAGGGSHPRDGGARPADTVAPVGHPWELDQEDDHDVDELGPDDVADEKDPRVGQLEALPDDDDPSDEVGEWQDVLAVDDGRWGALSSEEAAMHLIHGDDGGLTDHPDEWGPVWDDRR